MSFYELNKDERAVLYLEIKNKIEADIISGKYTASLTYFADEDTYIRKAAYIGIGKIFKLCPKNKRKFFKISAYQKIYLFIFIFIKA